MQARLLAILSISLTAIACGGGGGGDTSSPPPPPPVLAGSTFAATPAAITGGTAPTLSLPLPALTSVVGSAASVTLTVSSGGVPIAVAKSGGGAVGVADLGTTIIVAAPSTSVTDDTTYDYTLTVANAASPPVKATATATLRVLPAPTLASGTITVSPAAITGGTSPKLSLPLPSLASAAASAAGVTLTVASTGAPTPVTKHGGGAIGAADLGTTVTVDSPPTLATDATPLTYTLTVANGATTPASASATGTLTVVPAPTLSSGTITVSPAAITGGTSPTLSLPLPALTSAASAVSVTLQVNVGGVQTTVLKHGGVPVVLADLGTTVTVDAPPTLGTDAAALTYTLTVANVATTPGLAAATGTLTVVSAPALSSGTFTVSPAAITGGTSSTLGIVLPSLMSGAASAASVTLTVASSGAPTVVTKHGGGAIGVADLGTAITVDAPPTLATDGTAFTYTLTVANGATTPATAAATATLTVLPAPTLSAGSFTVSPAAITGGTSPTLSLPLPALTSAAGSATTVMLQGGPSGQVGTTVLKHGGGLVGLADLGTTITVDAPPTLATAGTVFIYTLTVSNNATTPGSASATGVLTVVPAPTLSGWFSIAPSSITGGTSPALVVAVPVISHATTVSLRDGLGNPALDASSGAAITSAQVLAASGATLTIRAPITLPSDAKTVTYTLAAWNAATTPANATASASVTIVPEAFVSSGADGAANFVTSTTLAAGVYNFTTITIPAGVTVSLSAAGTTGVLDLRATGAITIDGTLDLSGGAGGVHTDCLDNGAGAGGGVTAVASGAGQSGNLTPNFTGGPGGGTAVIGSAGGVGGGGTTGGGGGDNGGGGGGGYSTSSSNGGGGGGGSGWAGGGGGFGYYTGGTGNTGGAGGGLGGGAGGTSNATPGGQGGGGGGAPYDGANGANNPRYTVGGGGGGGGSIGADAVADLAMASTFRPGSGGGGGGGDEGTGGGGGGGAVRIASIVSITIGPSGRILANGGAGGNLACAGGAGGGGSGGALFLAAPAITIDAGAQLSATGGAATAPGGPGGLGRIRLSVDSTKSSSNGSFSPPLANGLSSADQAGRAYVAPWPQ